MAAGVVATVPVIAVFTLAQRAFLRTAPQQAWLRL
jgi:ABC-type glycerol-3-phosphate transport system permease component